MNNNNYQVRNQGMQQYPPIPVTQPEKSYKFRWWIILIPLSLIGFFWLLSGMDVAFTYEELMERCKVSIPDKHMRLAVLGICLATICIIIRVFRKEKEE